MVGGDKSEEVAVLEYIDAWSCMTTIEHLEYVSSLVGRVLVTISAPASISHAHFLAAMVTDYIEEKNVSWDPHSQALQHTQTRSHMWSQHRAPRR